MTRATRTLLAAVVALALLVTGPASVATTADGAGASAPGEDALRSLPDGVELPDHDDGTNETNDTDSIDDAIDDGTSITDGSTDDSTDATEDSTTDATEDSTTEDPTDDSTDDDGTNETNEGSGDGSTDSDLVDEVGDATDDATDATDDLDGTDGDLTGTVDETLNETDETLDGAGETLDETEQTVDGDATVEAGAFEVDGVRLTASVDSDGHLGSQAGTAVAVAVDGATRGEVLLRDENRSLVAGVATNGSLAPDSTDGDRATPAGDRTGSPEARPDSEDGGDGTREAASRPPIVPADVRLPEDAAPVAGGTAAVGGAVVLGYAARRFAGTASVAPASPAPQTASVLYDALRARELPDWIRWLPGVAGYSRYDDTDPLEHEKRAAIYDHLEATPGSYLSKVAEETEIPLPTVRYHLKILRHENEVESEVIRGKRRYFPAGFETGALAAAMDDESTAAVVRALESAGTATVSDLADRLDRDPSTVTHHLKRLEEDGIVVRERDGRSVLNSLDPAVEGALTPAPDAAPADPAAPADD